MTTLVFNNLVFEVTKLFIDNGNSVIHGREIARQLKQNQRTTQLCLHELVKAHILASHKAGRNIHYVLNGDNPKTKAIMLMTECYKTEKLLGNFEIAQILKDIQETTPKPFLVFGSHAKDYAESDSDLDILFIDAQNITIKNVQFKYKTRIHTLNMSEKKFIVGIKKKEAFPTEVLRHHILCQGYEFFINQWMEAYGKH